MTSIHAILGSKKWQVFKRSWNGQFEDKRKQNTNKTCPIGPTLKQPFLTVALLFSPLDFNISIFQIIAYKIKKTPTHQKQDINYEAIKHM